MSGTQNVRRSILLAAMVLVALGALAQNSPLGSNKPLPATLEEVGQILSRYPCTRGDFVQEKHIPAIGRSLTSSGAFLIAADRGIIWQTEKPYPSIMVVGRSHVSQGPEAKSLSRMDTGNNRLFMEFSQAISAAFSGDVQKIQDSFHVDFSRKGSNWSLQLEPRERTVAQLIQSIQLGGSAVLEEVTMTEQNGSTITYRFSNHQFSQEPTQDENQLFDR